MTNTPDKSGMKTLDPDSDESAIIRVRTTALTAPLSDSLAADMERVCKLASSRPPADQVPELVEKVARAICYWDEGGTCHDNYCCGECRAVRPDERFFNQARAAIAALQA